MASDYPSVKPPGPAPAPSPTNPYVGPRALESGEALFGRDDETVELLNQLIADRVVLMYAVSGAGKTSLLKAGLLPALEARGFTLLPVVQVRDAPPKGFSGNRYRLSVLQRLEAIRPEGDRLSADRLAGMTLEAYLRDRAPKAERGRVIVFDQFEDILRIDPTDTDVKREFFADVGAALREPGLWAVFSMREEYLAGLDPYLRYLPTRLASRFRLPLLTEEGAREAVCGPAEAVGIPFRPEVTDELVRQLRLTRVQQLDGTVQEKSGPYVEPVQLQVVCQLVWDRRPPAAAEIGPEALAGFSVDQALEEYYGRKVRAAAQAARVGEGRVRAWVEDRLITEQGLRGQVLRGQKETGGLKNQAVEELVGAYVVRAEQRLNAIWYELTHDRLVDPIRRSNRAWRRRRRAVRVMLYALPVVMLLGLSIGYGISGSIIRRDATIKELETELNTQQEREEKLKEEKEVLAKLTDELVKKTADPTAKDGQARPPVPDGSFRKRLWPKGETIRVAFLDGAPRYHAEVERYAQEWTKFANVAFEFGVAKNESDVRVSFTIRGASFSLLGTEARTAPTEATTQLGAVVGDSVPETEVRRLTLHEFGHVLGLLHEFNNPNRTFELDYPATLAYYRRVMPPGMSDETILRQLSKATTSSFGDKPFDPKSIMMYSFPRPIVKSGWSEDLGRINTSLSDGDKKFISQLYPFPPPTPIAVGGLEAGDHSRTQKVQRLKLDRYQFRASKPGRYVIATKHADPGLEVYLMGPGDEITQVTENDPKRPPESVVEVDLQPGKYVIKVRHLRPKNAVSYSIAVRYQGPGK